MNRVIVIGDTQGCWEEAIELLDNCKVRPEDHVIFAGDMIDRGPDNDKCVDLAIHRERIQGKPAAILGNHEDRHLQYRELEEKGKDPRCVIPTHVATRMQLRTEHYDYLKRLPLYIRLPEHRAAVVHAGAYPGLSLEEQDRRTLLHVQMIRPYDKWGNRTNNKHSVWPSKVPQGEDGWRFWTNFWDGPERLIFGHSVLNKPLLTDKVCGIDGGCCFGRELHAVILPDWEIVSVKSRTNADKGSRGRETKPIMQYIVHDDVATYS